MVYHDRLRYLQLRSALKSKEKMVVYDVGASEGHFALFVAKVRSVSTVYCFEPVGHIYEDLVRNTMGRDNVNSFRVALGDENGTKRMYVNDHSLSSSLLPMNAIHISEFPYSKNAHEEEIQVMTLKKAVAEFNLLPPDFIKMDVQGFEDRVIVGGEDIVRQASFCMIELSLVKLYEGSPLITDINLMMRKIGFRLVGLVEKIVGKSGEILQVDGLYRNEVV
jgi:FkbM family methyltransferase